MFFFRAIPYMGEKKHISKIPPKIPGQSREHFVYGFFSLCVFFAPHENVSESFQTSSEFLSGSSEPLGGYSLNSPPPPARDTRQGMKQTHKFAPPARFCSGGRENCLGCPRRNSKTQASLNFLQSGHEKFTRSNSSDRPPSCQF